jgi:hypothetical protein
MRRSLELATPIGPVDAWYTPEGLLLRDGSHRSCALYELQPSRFELQLAVSPAPPGAIDALTSLRAS